ncbi:DUF3054 domain-containing protein [Propioniciclava sp.]|uniref:DUF3054 domain-containing protein n=1 Tax=Propioniciclava sp. TaxID=2038686 RepID=UPI00261E2E55|nr:DUF3054 domain-containing protein [Propioniciclava sp.]
MPRWAMGVLDVVLVVVFAALGRSSHAEMVDAAGLLRTAGPFLVGLGSGWLALVLMRRQGDSVLDGVVLWLAALVGGMLVRRLLGDGTAVAFVVVAASVLALFLIGWRGGAALVARRGR